jgi:hypothetical protein
MKMSEEKLPQDNRPTEGEIPDILEWKLDVIMGQLAKMGGGQPSEHNPQVGGGTRERLPDPGSFNPEDPIPDYPGIPKILEWKLDVIIKQLGKMNKGLNIVPPIIFLFFNPLIFILVPGLGAIIVLLLIIAGLLSNIQALILFVVIQLAVPAIIARNRRRLARMHP